ncbi:hypothetical protein GCM10019016_008460 [Streptomyces prasinosporus]|uniref:Uncharacterized protein n=1 Tax=Streptomyces prasinosporus TaxID=68256 RepID=A0ABP6TEV5_9ACTN
MARTERSFRCSWSRPTQSTAWWPPPPRSPEDLTPGTEETLTAQGFTWNSDIEAYTRPTDHSSEAVDRTAGALRELGHYVFSAHTPLSRD